MEKVTKMRGVEDFINFWKLGKIKFIFRRALSKVKMMWKKTI